MPTGGDKVRTKHIRMRISPVNKEKVRRLAERYGLSLTDTMLMLIQQDYTRLFPEEPQPEPREV